MTAEKPIIFSGPMIKAILDGNKVQTRRVMKPQPYLADNGEHWMWDAAKCAAMWAVEVSPSLGQCCPYGNVGGRLWVRETFSHINDFAAPGSIVYKADGANAKVGYEAGFLSKTWRLSIHMPRWASRLTLEICDVRVQQVQDISEKDAEAEGASLHTWYCPSADEDTHISLTEDDVTAFRFPACYKNGFANLWDEINKKRGFPFESNPFVWCLTFRRVEGKGT